MIGFAEQIKDYYIGKKMAAQSMPASLFFRNGEENMGIVGLPFDLFISESHKLSFRVSDHPLQDGTVISDHVHRELQEVTIEGMFTNHPLNRANRPKEEVKFGEDYGEKDIPSVDVWTKESVIPNNALKNLEKLRDLAKKRNPVRLVCSLDVYPKMVITDLSYSRDAKSGSSVRFTVTLREIVTVKLAKATSSINFSPEQTKSANDRAIAAEKDLGKRNAEAERDAKEMTDLLNAGVLK